jgi:hypothetical protein
LELCSRHGLGSLDNLEIVGIEPTEVQAGFVRARHNAVSGVELALRQSAIRWLVFDTPILKLMAWGARRYYDIWDYTVGERLRQDFFRRSPYADQWR